MCNCISQLFFGIDNFTNKQQIIINNYSNNNIIKIIEDQYLKY